MLCVMVFAVFCTTVSGLRMSTFFSSGQFLSNSKCLPLTRRSEISQLPMSIRIECCPGDVIDDIIKRFKRACNQKGHLMELKYKEQWETAAEKRKRKKTRSKLLNRIERTNDRYERKSFGATEYNS